MMKSKSLPKWAALVPALLLLSVLQMACECPDAFSSEAEGVVSNLKAKNDAVLTDEKLDYAVAVYVTVENVGKAGVIEVSPKLSTSEGEWSRTQCLRFEAGETMHLKYLFQEPTINATGMQYRVEVFPKAK
jgi:hypothetical protein